MPTRKGQVTPLPLSRIAKTNFSIRSSLPLVPTQTSKNWSGHREDGDWLASPGIEELGRDVACEVESEWMVPLLIQEERDRLMAWKLGVSF